MENTILENTTTITGTVKQTLAQRRQEAIAKARKIASDRRETAEMTLLGNEAYVETLRVQEDKNAEFAKLKALSIQVESVTPFKAKDGRNFNVAVYPVSQFGVGLGQIVGLIKSTPFIDNQLAQYASILGVNEIDLLQAQEALGRTAYFKDGKFQPAIEGDFSTFKTIAGEISKQMDIHEFSPDKITKAQWDLYYTRAELKALEDQKAFELDQKIDSEADAFVMEDN